MGSIDRITGLTVLFCVAAAQQQPQLHDPIITTTRTSTTTTAATNAPQGVSVSVSVAGTCFLWLRTARAWPAACRLGVQEAREDIRTLLASFLMLCRYHVAIGCLQYY